MKGLTLAAAPPAPAAAPQSGFALARIALVAVFVAAAAFAPGWVRPFGMLGVDEIALVLLFVLSGYLTVQAHEAGWAPLGFLRRRVLRIYPAFALAFVVSLLAAGMTGGDLASLVGEAGAVQAARLLLLGAPWLDGAYAGLADPRVNPPLWVMGYLLRCCVLLTGLGMLGLVKERRGLLAVAMLLMALTMALPRIPIDFPSGMAFVTGTLHDNIRFAAFFVVGGVLFRYADRLRFSAVGAGIAVVLIVPALLSFRYAGPAVAVFGGYAMVWLARAMPAGQLDRAVGRGDVAYGMFLYGWPVHSLLVWQLGAQPAWAMAGLTLCLSAGMGGVSWLLLHRTMPGGAAPKAEG